jgi:RHS repeat-associated protein
VATRAINGAANTVTWTLDALGRVTSDDAITLSSHDKLNRFVTQVPGSSMVFAGTVNEPATVTIQGTPATVSATNDFRGTASLTSGTNTVTIVATDGSGTSTTRQWTVDVAGQTTTFTFDANGNLTTDGIRSFEWDARNQLAALTVGTQRSEFTYDGLQRRASLVQKENGVTQSDTKVIWCATEICEERGADGISVMRRAFVQGEEATGIIRYFAADHLGSVSELTNESGTLLARYAFDPWGTRTLAAGSDITNVGFTGHRQAMPSSDLLLAQYRSYSPSFARWTSEDPLGPLEKAEPIKLSRSIERLIDRHRPGRSGL